MSDASGDPIPPDAPPPLLGSWGNLYAVVIGTLVVLIGVGWMITEAYR